MKKHLLLSLVYTSALAISGCSSTSEEPKSDVQQQQPKDVLDESINDTSAEPVKAKPLSQVPLSVQQDIMQQGLATARDSLMLEKRMDVAANQIPATNFFSAIVADSDFSIAIHPDVTGSITLNLSEVTLSETLDIVQDLYGYDIRKSNRIIQVYPAGMRTQTIALDYLFLKRSGLSSTSMNSGGVSTNDPNSGNGSGGSNGGNSGQSNGSSQNNNNGGQSGDQSQRSGINIYTENESDYWTELKDTLESLIGTEGGRNIIVSPHAGLITIRALPNEIKAIEEFIERSQKNLRRQVIIEAKILEVTLNDDYQQGISWAAIGDVDSGNIGFSTSGNIAGNAISSVIGGGGGFAVSGTDFSGLLTLLSTQGQVQTLSSPRVTATNNQKAVIKVGEDEYFVTEVSSTTIAGGSSTTVTPEIELTPFFSGIALDVTPQINENGEVILHVHPSVTETSEQVKSLSFNGGNILLPLARSRVRESDTIVKAKSGEIIVLGGLIESSKTDIVSKTPYLGDIPFLGELFTNRSESIVKKELVILIKPIVIGKGTWQDQIKEARSLLQKWFPETE
ncbi:pilus (MSHA type) biogenesis protein MshL [Colwelliaceae bacterium BS250]